MRLNSQASGGSVEGQGRRVCVAGDTRGLSSGYFRYGVQRLKWRFGTYLYSHFR